MVFLALQFETVLLHLGQPVEIIEMKRCWDTLLIPLETLFEPT